MILPTGIATDDTTKAFFGDLVKRRRLIQLTGYENEAFIFPAVHHFTKFCTLVVAANDNAASDIGFVFFIRHFPQLRDARRHFKLSADDIESINPNTLTCPIFRTRHDAELAREIYRRVPVLFRENQLGDNPWGIRFLTMFHMSNDSHQFHDADDDGRLPLYEGKLFHHFDHRYATFEGATNAQLNVGTLPQVTPEKKATPHFRVLPRYWVAEAEMLNRLTPPAEEESRLLADGKLSVGKLLQQQRKRAPKWLLAFRDITNATNERTAISSFLPRVATGHKAPLFFVRPETDVSFELCLLANFNSLVLDFIVRQKLGGTSLTYFIIKQLPVLPPNFYGEADVAYVASRVLELVYTADDMQPLAEAVLAQLGTDGWSTWFPQHSVTPQSPLPTPFIWNEERRAHLRAELDAWFARAYGLTRKQLRYILDPADLTPRELENILDPWEEVADPLNPAGYAARAAASDFPSETFRVLKEKEQAKYGEYRTRRLVLEAWERLPQQ